MPARRPNSSKSTQAPPSIRTRIKETEQACLARGLQFTRSRKAVLEILWAADRPLGAYEILRIMSEKARRPVNPPTVYRALDFLSGNRFISKLESANSFVPCAHPHHPHACVFFICQRCGSSAEIENSTMEHLILDNARAIGFQVSRRIIELQGTCTTCTETLSL